MRKIKTKGAGMIGAWERRLKLPCIRIVLLVLYYISSGNHYRVLLQMCRYLTTTSFRDKSITIIAIDGQRKGAYTVTSCQSCMLLPPLVDCMKTSECFAVHA